MPKMSVRVTDEKPHIDWYTGYKGVGAAEPARKDTVMEASK
jgi:hypothetical protein